MTERHYALRLVGLPLPAGHLRGTDLVAIAAGLQGLVSRIARQLTGNEGQGRSPAVVEAVSALIVTGLGQGSTVLAFDLGDPNSLVVEDGLDDQVAGRFDQIVSALPANAPPGWLSPVVGEAVAELVTALRASGATSVDVQRGDVLVGRAAVAALNTQVWSFEPRRTRRETTVTGILFAVDTHARRFRITDDLGQDISLVAVAEPESVARLVTDRVVADGLAEYDESGRLRQLITPVIRAGGLPDTWRGPAPHREPIRGGELGDGIAGLTDDEVDEFLAGR